MKRGESPEVEGIPADASVSRAGPLPIGNVCEVMLDCSALEYLSSAGLGVLLKTQKRLLASAGKLRLTGVGRHLMDIFTYSGFDQIFEIEAAG